MTWLRKAAILLSVQYAAMLEYRAELYLWALSGLFPFIMMGVWVKASSQGSYALGPLEFARYFIAVFIVRQLTVVWVIWEFEPEVVRGNLSARLLQPIDPVWKHVAGHIAERFARGPFLLLLIGLFFMLYPAAFFVPSFRAALLASLATFAAFALRFLMQYSFALLSFWTERAASIDALWYLIYLMLSGMLAPLETYPPAVRDFALLTPFPYVLYFPAQLLLGNESNLLRGFLVIGLWSTGFFILNRILWARGLRQYSGMGA